MILCLKMRSCRNILLVAACLLTACTDTPTETATTESASAITSISAINFAVIKAHPHDTAAFTEGLQFYNDKLFESTGSPAEMPQTRSVIGEVNRETGKLQKKIELNRDKYFGEGMVFLDGKLYQLTYTTKIGFVYDAQTFKQLDTFTFPSKEGWGLTTDGKHLIMSDGTATVTYLTPGTFQVARTLHVTDEHGALENINELEYIHGAIYANVYTTPYIVKIDPQTGKVTGRMDLSSLQHDAKAKNPKALEMNGIAFDPATNKWYVTGKFWPTIYELNVSM